VEATYEKASRRALKVTSKVLGVIDDLGTRFIETTSTRYLNRTIPEPARRLAVLNAVDSGVYDELSGEERSAFRRLESFSSKTWNVQTAAGFSYTTDSVAEVVELFSTSKDPVSRISFSTGGSILSGYSVVMKNAESPISVSIRSDPETTSEYGSKTFSEIGPFQRWWSSIPFWILMPSAAVVTLGFSFAVAVTVDRLFGDVTSKFAEILVWPILLSSAGAVLLLAYILRQMFPLMEIDIGLHQEAVDARKKLRVGLITVPVFVVLIPVLINLATSD
jgi:hypothetical protein